MRIWPLLLFALAACNTPGQPFRGLPATRVTVEGSVFEVRIAEDRAEAIRVNTQYAPRFGPIRERARIAMAEVSGCEVKTVQGDILHFEKGAKGHWKDPRKEMELGFQDSGGSLMLQLSKGGKHWRWRKLSGGNQH